MSRVGERDDDAPRAMVHKRILDVARGNPESTLEDLAAEVPAATPDLVDRVLAEYGDPAAPATDQAASATDQAASDTESAAPADDARPESQAMSQNGTSDANATNGQAPTADEAPTVTDKQRATLAAVRDRPTASQSEIADELGVTSATVSRRLNDLPGFDWTDRAQYAEKHLGPGESDEGSPDADSSDADSLDAGSSNAGSSTGSDLNGSARGHSEIGPTEIDAGPGEGGTSRDLTDTPGRENGETRDETDATARGEGAPGDPSVAELETRIEAIEDRLAAMGDREDGAALEPELVHKVAHACLASDEISREEELDVLHHLMG